MKKSLEQLLIFYKIKVSNHEDTTLKNQGIFYYTFYLCLQKENMFLWTGDS